MKTAICFHGQPRFYEITYDKVWSKMVEKHNADVFIHTYWSKDSVGELYPVRVKEVFNEEDLKIKEDTIKKLTDLYKPIYIDYNWYNDDIIYNHNHNYYQYYTQYSVKNLKCNHEQKNNFKYDMVIRTRFDFITSKLEYDIDLTNLAVPDNCPNEALYSDIFSISNSEVFDKISDCYLNLKDFEQNGNGHTEYAFKEQITKESIPVIKMKMACDILRSDLIGLSRI